MTVQHGSGGDAAPLVSCIVPTFDAEEHLPGALACEPFRAVPVRIRHDNLWRREALTGLPADPRLSRALGVPVTVGNIYQSEPSVSDAVAAASGDVLVLPYALAPGLWGERIAGLGARVSAPLGDHEGVTAAIVERYVGAVGRTEAPRAAA